MPTFGDTAIEDQGTDTWYYHNLILFEFNLPENGNVTSMTLYCKRGTANQEITCCIYSDTGSTQPNLLQGTTQAVAVSTTLGWVQFDFASPISLSAGNYWLGWLGTSGTSLVYNNFRQKTVYNYWYISSQSSFPNDLSAVSPDYHANNYACSIYATYNLPGMQLFTLHNEMNY